MLNRHMRHFSFWHSLIKIWRYMVKSTTVALRKNEYACWKVDNTGFVSHLTEVAWLTVSKLILLIFELWLFFKFSFSSFNNSIVIFKFQKQYFISDFQTMPHDKSEI